MSVYLFFSSFPREMATGGECLEGEVGQSHLKNIGLDGA